MGKSAIAFSASTSLSEREALSNLMGMKLVKCHEKYLGLPTVIVGIKQKSLEM